MASAWQVYNLAKKKIGNGTLSLAGAFNITLHTSAMRTSLALSTYASLSGEVASGNGYEQGGKALDSVAWTVGASAGQYKFDAGDVFWSADGATIEDIKWAVIHADGASAGARHVLCRSQLSSSPFGISAGNRLTIQMAAGGILTLA